MLALHLRDTLVWRGLRNLEREMVYGQEGSSL